MESNRYISRVAYAVLYMYRTYGNEEKMEITQNSSKPEVCKLNQYCTCIFLYAAR